MRFDCFIRKAIVAQTARNRALTGLYDGTVNSSSYLSYCSHVHDAGATVIFTRDYGHHACGWWKNSDYERCWHLSLAFFDPETMESAPKDLKETLDWIEVFFGAEASKLWAEPPYSPHGRARDVWHYRLFCDPHWQPIVPRGEVYSTKFTEIGWKSFSELQKEKADEVHVPRG